MGLLPSSSSACPYKLSCFSQVLVGHEDEVTCVALAMRNSSPLLVSGSRDHNIIVWDVGTGSEALLLQGHLDVVTCVRISADGTVAVSGEQMS